MNDGRALVRPWNMVPLYLTPYILQIEACLLCHFLLHAEVKNPLTSSGAWV